MPSKIPIIELRKLLSYLKDQPNTAIRVRLVGKMWMENFARITLVTERGVILNDEGFGKIIQIPDIAEIYQFELDSPFQNFQPYYHYDVESFAS